MATDYFRGDSPNGENAIQKIDWFGVCYWAAAGVQVVGSFGVFGTVGGSPLHAIAGALCLELMILALNAYGVKQSGKWMACICAVSLFLVGASAMFQVAELLSHPADAELATRLGAGYYGVLRTTVPVVPSVAMALVTLIKFVDARRNGVDLGAVVAQRDAHIQQLQADNSKALHQNGEVLQRNERLQAEHDALVAQLEQERAQHEHELHEVATAQRVQRVVQPKAQPAQLSSGMTFEQGVAQLKAQGVPVGATALGNVVGKHKATASKWLAKHPEVQS